MKRLKVFLILAAIFALAYFTFPLWVIFVKAFIGIMFLSLFIVGIIVGRFFPKRKR